MTTKLLTTVFLSVLYFSLFGQENSIHFDGSNDYVNCGNNGSLNITGTTITLEAWIYPTAFKSNVWEGNIINKNGGGDNGYMLRVGNGGQVNFNIGTGWWNEINSPVGAVSLNTWHHVAGTYDGTTMRLYVDGVEVVNGAETQNIGSASNSLYLGEDPQWTGRYFPGRIEEVRIWNTARTAAEVLEDMNTRTCAPLPAGLVAYYRFNQGTANVNNSGLTTVIDETGTNNGILNNSSLNGTSSNWVDGLTLNCPANMTYVSSTTTQNNTTGVSICGSNADNQEIIGIEVVTTGTLNPIDLTRIRIQTNGSSDPLNDISNIDIYYTGTSPIFATTTLFGSGAPLVSGNNIAINSSQTLAEGTNYFWVVYDIPSSATVGNTVDALCNRVRVDGVNNTPSPTAPTGDRRIAGCPGDEPCTAFPIIAGCGGVKVDGDNTSMTNSGISAPSCGTYVSRDIWYTLAVPASGIVKVETYAKTLTDAAMSIYSTSGNCSSALTQIACDDNSGFGAMPKIALYGLTPGNILYVRVWDPNDNQAGTFEIDAADLSFNYCVTGDGTDQGAGCAQLTAATNGQLGSIWDADDKLDFTTDWSYDFTVNLGTNDAGADGICFVIHNDPTALGTTGLPGNAMGAGGISNSLIVEIDTYLNTEDRNDGLTGPTCVGGTDPDHLDIWLNGDVNPGGSSGCPGIGGVRYIPNAVNLLNGGTDYNIENGLDHVFRISYASGTQTLTASVRNSATTITYGTVSYSPVNPMTLFGTNAPYFGFTASTGGLNNQQAACLPAELLLPVELDKLDANCVDGEMKLKWNTTTETNNDYFSVERSLDAINFEPIAQIKGHKNTAANNHYEYTDEHPIQGTSYYRLKQTNLDGTFSYSEIVTESCQRIGGQGINVFPNPFKESFVLNLWSTPDAPIHINLSDYTGKLLYKQTFKTDLEQIELPIGRELLPGVYVLKVDIGGIRYVRKLIKN
ncbi:MAG: T9SS type A sorting domain-containing protein [Aureispira sp.]|nr:T9SS type A sorting domain-containing protein [Aureispira sp.]